MIQVGEEQIEQRHLPLESSYNIRDVGGYTTSDGYTTRWRTFLRADSLHRLTPASQQYLIDYGLRTIIDLRYERELATAPDVFANSSEVNYVNISLMAEAAPNAERRYWPDLESLYKYILDERQEVVKAVFDVMTQEAFPVLIHCTAGKDRTGIITALMLGLADVNHAIIAEDYALTAYFGGGMFDQFRAQAAEAGRDMAILERYLEAKPEAMLNTLAHLEATYQNVPTYLQHIGLTTTQLNRLRQTIVAK